MSKKLNKVEWNWDHFNSNHANTQWFMAVVRQRFDQYLPENGKILEIGCGTGNILTHAARIKERKCYGIDIDPNSETLVNNFAKQRSVKVIFKQASGLKVPYKENTFDAVYSEGVIEHFTHEDTKKMVSEHLRVVKPKGTVIISVPNTYNLAHTLAKKIRNEKYAHYPEKSYSPRELAQLIEDCGGKTVMQDGFAWQHGLAHLRFLKHLITILRHIPESSIPPGIRASIGFETMNIAIKK